MYKLNKTLLLIVKIPTAIISIFTTLLLGIIGALTFGISTAILHTFKDLFFIYPVVHASKLYHKYGVLGKFLSIVGIPFSIIGLTYSMLIGHSGQQDLRAYDLTIFETFPYSNSFDDYAKARKDWDDLSEESRESIMYITQDEIFLNAIEDYRVKYSASKYKY